MVPLSIVMPIHQKETTLPRVLDALAKQDDPGGLELVLVFDACTDGSMYVVDASPAVQRYPTRTLQVSEHHPARVRNLGASAAGGEQILFLDADVVLPPQHIRALRHRIGTDNTSILLTPVTCNAVSAEMLPLLASLPQDWHALDNDRLLEWSQTWPELADSRLAMTGDDGSLDHLPYPWVLGWSTALCVPRGLFTSCGGFDDHYVGKGSEDLVFCRRLWRAGARFQLLAEAPALHLPHARDRKAEVALDRHHEALLLSTIPKPDVELLCAFDGGHANAMAAFLAKLTDAPARERLASAFLPPLDFGPLGVDAPVALAIGLPPGTKGCEARRAWPFPNGLNERAADLPLFGFALPFADGSLGTVVVGGLFELLPQRLRMRQITEAQRIASRVVLVRLNERIAAMREQDGAVAMLDAPYWETYFPLHRDPWLHKTTIIGSFGPYTSYTVSPLVH